MAVPMRSEGSDAGATAAAERILDATLAVLARGGLAAVTMRAVARQAEVSVGLANYYFESKAALVAAALRRIGEQDAAMVAPAGPDDDAVVHLTDSLERALDPAYLHADYLSLRLQLWSLAGVDPAYAKINRDAQQRYLKLLGTQIRAARPDLSAAEVGQRAADILTQQNGVWLTAILIDDQAAVDRAIERCKSLAFG